MFSTAPVRAPSARAVVLVAIVAVTVSANSLRNGHVYDDVPVIGGDTRIRDLSSLPGLVTGGYWTGDYRDRLYRPWTTLSFALDWSLGGGSPFWFHLGNVLLHALDSVLVLLLAAGVLGGGALVAALLFAVHPVHVEAVANGVGRGELLAALGYLGALIAFRADARLAQADRDSRRRYLTSAAVLGLTILAYGAKEHALTLPAAMVIVSWWDAKGTGDALAARLRRQWVLLLAAVVLAAGYLAARSSAIGTLGAGQVAPGLEGLAAPARLLAMLPAALVWGRLLAFPLRLSADYGPDAFAIHSAPAPIHLVALALIAGSLGTVWLLRRRAPALVFATLWLAVTLAVASNVVVPTGVTIAERTLYLPSVGTVLAAGALWELLPPGRVLWPATAVVLTMFAARSLSRSRVWQDPDRFTEALLADAPDSFRSHWARGAMAFERGDPAAGERAYRAAIALHPDPAIVQELGERYLAAEMYDAADRYLSAAWEADRSRADAAIGAILARTGAGRARGAAELGESALLRFPDAPAILLGTAAAWEEAGRPLRALTLRRLTAFRFPDEWRFHYLAAASAAASGLCAEARRRVDRALALEGGSEAARQLSARLESSGARCGIPPR